MKIALRAEIALTIFATLLSNSLCAANAQTDVRQIADRVDRHYNSLRSMQATFTEIYKGAGISRTESGELWLKRPGRMRWEYQQPAQKLFLSDGETSWFYLPADKQVRKVPMKKLDDLRSPLAYLLGRTKLQKEFDGLSFAPDVKPLTSGNIVLRGIPKRMNDSISQVLFEVTPEGRIQRIVIEQVDDSVTEFRFANQQDNLPVSDQRFRFSPPPGVETVEETASSF